ncbi:MAG: hypothetical protein NC548_49085 [Lachnospiraceae bacterium]|nr:hypothetical protein [Lachnospiraceae bacterium]
MPYEILLKQAHSIVDEIPREKIGYVVQFLQSAKGLYSAAPEKHHAEERKRAGKDLLKFAGTLRADFDEEKELDEWRAERFATAN